jgi:hypothetical protein
MMAAYTSVLKLRAASVPASSLEPPELEPELDPELEPELEPELDPEPDPELEPELDPELEPEPEPEPDASGPSFAVPFDELLHAKPTGTASSKADTKSARFIIILRLVQRDTFPHWGNDRRRRDGRTGAKTISLRFVRALPSMPILREITPRVT